MGRIIVFLTAILYCLSCDKSSKDIKDNPVNYREMFERLNIQPGISYKYAEIINNKPSGKEGFIRFALSDTTMEEIYNNYKIKARFRLDSFQKYTCHFESQGFNKYNPIQSTFINNSQHKISYVNGKTMVSFGIIDNGSFYSYQYHIFQ